MEIQKMEIQKCFTVEFNFSFVELRLEEGVIIKVRARPRTVVV